MPDHQHRNANAAPPQPRARRSTRRAQEWIEGTLIELDADAERLVLRVERSSRGGTREGDELAVWTDGARIKAGDGDGDGRAGVTDLFPGDALHIALGPRMPGDPPRATRVTQLNPAGPVGGLRRLWAQRRRASS